MSYKEVVNEYETVFTVTVEHHFATFMRSEIIGGLKVIKEEIDFEKALNELEDMGWIDEADLWTEQLECYGHEVIGTTECDECPMGSNRYNFCRGADY